MSLFAGRSRAQRDHVVATLQSLGPTTVEGLAAALSWSTRRTDKVLRDAAGRPDGIAIHYNRNAGTVRWSFPSAPVAAPTPPSTPKPSPAPGAPPTPALPKSWVASARCPTCQIALETTGTGGMYCPHCGRLASAAPSSRASSSVTPATAAPAPSLVVSTSSPARSGAAKVPLDPADRKAQEMFAAWVTARPIPCPKCKTPLRHRGLATYGCPACGAQIAFEKSPGVPPVSAGVPTGPSGPSGPTL